MAQTRPQFSRELHMEKRLRKKEEYKRILGSGEFSPICKTRYGPAERGLTIYNLGPKHGLTKAISSSF